MACILCDSREYAPVVTENEHELVRCNKCGLLYILGSVGCTLSELYESPDAQTVNVDTQMRFKFEQELIARSDLNIIKQFVTSGRVLEVGCGAGYFLNYAKKQGFETVGIEVNNKLVEFARTELGANVQFGTIQDVQLLDDSFDVVYMRNVLSHLENPLNDLRTISKKLKAGGILMLETGNVAGLTTWQIKKYQRQSALGLPEHRFFLSSTTLHMISDKVGLQLVLSKEYSMYLQLLMERKLISKGRKALADIRPNRDAALKERILAHGWYFLLYTAGRILPKRGPCTVKYVLQKPTR